MKVDLYEERGDEKTISVHHNRSRITVRNCDERVRVSFAATGGSECDRVSVSFDECYTCDEWRQLLCELGRVCGCSPCEPWGVRFDDDDDDCGCDDGEQTVRVTVRDVREAIKGLSADDVIELSE